VNARAAAGMPKSGEGDCAAIPAAFESELFEPEREPLRAPSLSFGRFALAIRHLFSMRLEHATRASAQAAPRLAGA